MHKTEFISRVRGCERRLYRIAHTMLRSEADCEDAVQETFLKAYHHLPSFRGESSPKTWLVRIAINVCKDMSRTSWFRIFRNMVELDRCHIAQPEGEYEVHSALVTEIMCLPRLYREVVLLHYYEGFTQAETAQALHISIATVNRRLKKACCLLRNELKGGSIHEA